MVQSVCVGLKYLIFFFRNKQCENDKNAAEETARKLGQVIVEKDSKK